MTDAEYRIELEAGLGLLDLPRSAVDFLLGLWDAIQLFDDVADGDSVERAALDAVINFTLIDMPLNQFYRDNGAWLIPVMALAVVKWQASDAAERSGKADARSYMWRAGFYEVVSACAAITHGQNSQQAKDALSLYGEAFEDYQKEFRNA